jgi:hypothetical protein
MHLKNHSNQYVDSLPPFVFDKIPKAVWAALAISALTCGGDYLEEATKRIVEEWTILNQNGIIKQAPPKSF